MPLMISDRCGEHPFGTHWTLGECREVSDADAASAPKWLTVEAKKPAKKPAKKSAETESDKTTEG